MTAGTTVLTNARAEALFASDMSAWSQCTRADVEAAIRQAVRRYGGIRGCLEQVAAAYGDRPETAAPRMRWARRSVSAAYGRVAHRTTEVGLHGQPSTLALAA
jgi:hypothetical protein